MKNKTNEVSMCEVCGDKNLASVLNLGMHPLCDDLVSIGDGRVCAEYPIEILFCHNCTTAHQRFQVPKQDLFPITYHYRSRFTADVLKGMEGLVNSCEQRLGSLRGKKVLDIGCNDGSLLDFFRTKGAITLGIEPTGAHRDAAEKEHIVINDFLSLRVADAIVEAYGKPDFITFTNVFAHIEDLHEVISALKRLVSPQTVIVIENHYLGAVLEGNQFDTFYHEHPRTYSYSSFSHIAHSLGLEILGAEFPSRYGGNIRVFLGNETDRRIFVKDAQAPSAREGRFLEVFSLMRLHIESWRTTKAKLIQEQVSLHGRLRAKAFPGRAAILVKLLNLNEDLIEAVYEKPGSLKIGHYLPGTRIPIRSDDELFASPNQTAPLLNLAWHISGEIRTYLLEHGYTGRVIDILSNEDFTRT
jgi:SAM-dependent methyltransferase